MTHRIGSRRTWPRLLGTLLLLCPAALADDDGPSLVPAGYLDADALSSRLREIAEAHPDSVSIRSIAETGEGRDVWLVTLGIRPDEDDEDGDRPPAILIVGNLEGDHLVGSEVAIGLIERLADPGEGQDEAIAGLLKSHTVYIVPRLNPDGAERLFDEPRRALRTNLTPTDEDRDGTDDEDGPDGLDADGLILRMRVKDEKATLIPDPDDPRSLRPAKAAEGERAVYSEYDEGTDLDADGEINEDPPGGVNLNRNWPHDWTELNDRTGFSPASEPEVRGLIQFCYDHPEIALVWTFALHDSLREEPKKPETKLADADLPYFVALSQAYRKAIAPSKAEGEAEEDAKDEEEDEEADDAPKEDEPADEPMPEPEPVPDGVDPLAALPDGIRDRVMAAFEALPADRQQQLMDDFEGADPATRGRMLVQFIAGLNADEAEMDEEGEESDPARDDDAKEKEKPKPGGGSAPKNASALGATTDGAMSEWAYHQFGAIALSSSLWPGPTLAEPAEGEKKLPAEGDERWLSWNDHVMGGRAFVGFEEVEHPTLGTVEVGGWLPGVRINPPIEEVEGITEARHRFLADLAGRMPSLEIVDAKAEPKGGGVFEVTARVENPGYFPTSTAQGVTTRQSLPILVRPDLGDAKLLGGPALDRIDALAGSGGSREYRWLILAPEGVDSITLEASGPRAGKAVEVIELR